MGVKKEIIVAISYFDFKFDSLQAANNFAEVAALTIDDKNKDIRISVRYIPDDADDAEKEEEE